jgi:predicted  nucleic acid-binding Zn-ribbon protein
MNASIEAMLQAQKILIGYAEDASQYQAALQKLRATVPAPLLAHFLRFIGQGQCGVAIVRNGICTECHLRVALAMTSALARSEDVHVCENCGCYLVLAPEEEQASAAPLAKPKSRRVSPAKQTISL